MTTTKNAPIPALYFDRDGLGPDHVALEVALLPDEIGAELNAGRAMGLRIRGVGLVMHLPIDGGFMLGEQEVKQLHEQLGAWLEASRG
jgi:hypothetical protein